MKGLGLGEAHAVVQVGIIVGFILLQYLFVLYLIKSTEVVPSKEEKTASIPAFNIVTEEAKPEISRNNIKPEIK